MPHLKDIYAQKLAVSDKAAVNQYKDLDVIIGQAMDQELITKQHDEMVKYATALRLGTVHETPVIVPTKASAELPYDVESIRFAGASIAQTTIASLQKAKLLSYFCMQLNLDWIQIGFIVNPSESACIYLYSPPKIVDSTNVRGYNWIQYRCELDAN
ncbi:MAG: Tn3 family transposase [Candidatus Promineifilaceae bacterium]